MRTYFPKQGDIEPRWFIIDADGQVLGRLSTTIAKIISGKTKPTYTPFLDTGDHVVIINADKVKVTGMKAEQKSYQHYTGYPGGLRSEDFRERFARKPEMVVEDAIKRMLPKSKLGRQMISKLKIYRGDKHPHEAQKPETRKLAVRA